MVYISILLNVCSRSCDPQGFIDCSQKSPLTEMREYYSKESHRRVKKKSKTKIKQNSFLFRPTLVWHVWSWSRFRQHCNPETETLQDWIESLNQHEELNNRCSNSCYISKMNFPGFWVTSSAPLDLPILASRRCAEGGWYKGDSQGVLYLPNYLKQTLFMTITQTLKDFGELLTVSNPFFPFLSE